MQKTLNNYKKRFLVKSIICTALAILLGLFFLLRLSSAFAEWWSIYVARKYQLVVGFITSLIPFSLTECFIIVCVFSIITWLCIALIHVIRRGLRGSNHLWLNASIIGLSIGLLYMCTAGISYNRKPINLPQHTELIKEPTLYKEIAYSFIIDFNNCSSQFEYEENGSIINLYSHIELSNKIKTEYQKLNQYFSNFTVTPKEMYLTGWLYREFGISGISFLPFGEANINHLTCEAYKPFVYAHEIAHTNGFMKEDEANLLAAYICLKSDDAFLRYSGYMWTISSFLDLVYVANTKEDYKEVLNSISDNIWSDINYQKQYLESHDTLSKIGTFFNDLYLKLSGTKGTQSYSDIGDISIKTNEDGTQSYIINSYSPYQALYLWLYFNK